MGDFLQYILQGIPVGCVYALLAVGLVLTYRTTGVFNLAYGAQAFAAGIVFYDLNVRRELPLWVSFVVAVLVVGPLIGAILDLALFRHLRGATWAARLVASLGLFVAIPEMTLAWFGRKPATRAPTIAPLIGIEDRRVFRFDAGDFHLNLSASAVVVIIVTVVVLVALVLGMRYSAAGLKMRAVVESPRLTELAGVDADRVGLGAWMFSSMLASLAGVLVAPLYPSVNQTFYFGLLVAAIAAAAFGRLSSIGLTFAGALLLAIAQQVLSGELPTGSVLSQGIRPSLPFIMLFGVLVAFPAIKRRREVTDPLSGVDPPRFAPAAAYKDDALRRLTRFALPAFLAVFIALNVFVLSDLWVGRFTEGLVMAVILLSITVFTGMSGQISLGQAAFAGIGAFATGQLATNAGVPVVAAVLVGALIAALVGALLAIPAVRLAGIFLSLATLAFALFMEAVIFPQTWVSGPPTAGIRVPRPTGFESDQAFFVFVFAVFGLVALVVILTRNGTTGRFLAAMRGSEVAAAAIGIDSRRQRIILFAMSAAIAAVGGSLFAMRFQQTSTSNWFALYGAVWVVIVVTIGVRTVDGAVIAGMSFVLVQWLFRDAWNMEQSFAIILFGLGAITYARHPEGVAEWRTRITIEGLVRNRQTVARAAVLRDEGRPLPGYRPAIIDVGLVVVTAGLWLLVLAGQGYSTVKRIVGDGFSTALGVILAVLVVPLFFMLPHRLSKAFEARGEEPPVRWNIGIGPTVLLAIATYVLYRYYTLPLRDIPSDIGVALAVAFAVITLLQWVSQVRGALNLLAVAEAEETATQSNHHDDVTATVGAT